GARDGGDDLDRLLRREAAFLEQLGERLPVEVVHDDEVAPALVADLVDLDDVRVVERGGELGLLLEASEELRVRRGARREDLDRVALAGRAPLLGLEEDAHAAAGDLAPELV